MLMFELIVIKQRGVILLLQQFLNGVHFQIARQAIIEIADPENCVVIFDRFAGECRREN